MTESTFQAQDGVKNVSREVRLEIIAQAAEALQAAHDAGIIHRDDKPGNILVSGEPLGAKRLAVKLTDFGIGQVVSTGTASAPFLIAITADPLP